MFSVVHLCEHHFIIHCKEYGVLQYPYDSSMVSPSCCLEYRPTGAFWAILFFVVFPAIYLSGKVVGTFLTVLLRVLRGLCKLLLWDDEDYEEEAEELRLERQRKLLEKENARRLRREERAKKRADAAARQLAEKNEKACSFSIFQIVSFLIISSLSSSLILSVDCLRFYMASLVANGGSRNGVAKCMPPSDLSESLNSECETDEQRVTPSIAEGTTIVEEKTLTNGHVPTANGGADVTSTSTLRHRTTHQ
ncbi:hypothetical protein NECAME_05142 [Necator americanus]|uniref:Uncharacterized protein n=1 Tax=Necator americanus TaxID=51031 RepID=W2SLT2_NECAM|nr:hypothetical protein NECAME_05142 [Necator americanus]ETN69687.1 hypothetical protein NECAME_05142 [Necator americanus]